MLYTLPWRQPLARMLPPSLGACETLPPLRPPTGRAHIAAAARLALQARAAAGGPRRRHRRGGAPGGCWGNRTKSAGVARSVPSLTSGLLSSATACRRNELWGALMGDAVPDHTKQASTPWPTPAG